MRVAMEGPRYESRQYGEVPFLDASAILDGGKLHAFVTNRSTEEDMELTLAVGGADVTKVIDADIVSGTDPKATNTFEQPDRVVSRPLDGIAVGGAGAVLKLPPLSVAAVTLELGVVVLTAWPAWVIAAVAAVLTLRFRVNAAWVVVGAAAAGWALSTLV